MQLARLIIHSKIPFMPPYCSLPHSGPGKAKHLMSQHAPDSLMSPESPASWVWARTLLHVWPQPPPFTVKNFPTASVCDDFSTPCSLSERMRNVVMGVTISLKGQFPRLWREAEEQRCERINEKKDSKNILPFLYQTPLTCSSQKTLPSECFSWHQDSMSSITAATQLKSRHRTK